MNTALLIGQITNDIAVERKGEYNFATIYLKVQRDYKSSSGEYIYDYIPISLWEGLVSQATQKYHKGMYVSVRARISTFNGKNEDGTYDNRLSIVGEKLSVLPQQNQEEGLFA